MSYNCFGRSLLLKKEIKERIRSFKYESGKTAGEYEDEYYKKQYFEACKYGDIEKVRESLCMGVNINACDDEGNTGLVLASGYGKLTIVRYLISKGAGFYQKKGSTYTDTNIALFYAKPYVNSFEYREIINLLTQVNEQNGLKKQYFEACIKGNIEKVKECLSKGIDVNVCDDEGNTGLMFACAYGHNEIVKYLTSCGGDLQQPNKKGKSALNFLLECRK